jgi:hypothetical protein
MAGRLFFILPVHEKKKSGAGRMFFILPATGLGPIGHCLPLEACFSFFQFTRKRNPVLEGCFSFFQHTYTLAYKRKNPSDFHQMGSF